MKRIVSRFARSTLRVAAVISVVGCAQTFDATSLGVPVSMASSAGTQERGQEFRIDKKAVYLLAGIVKVTKPSLEKALAAQVTSGAQVTDVKIRVRSRWSDVLITILTAGLIVPRSVTFEGRVIQP